MVSSRRFFSCRFSHLHNIRCLLGGIVPTSSLSHDYRRCIPVAPEQVNSLKINNSFCFRPFRALLKLNAIFSTSPIIAIRSPDHLEGESWLDVAGSILDNSLPTRRVKISFSMWYNRVYLRNSSWRLVRWRRRRIVH